MVIDIYFLNKVVPCLVEYMYFKDLKVFSEDLCYLKIIIQK